MHQPHPAQDMLDELLARLQLSTAGPDQAYGEIEGSPVTVTVLGGEPLALLLGFKIRSDHPAEIALPDDIAALVGAHKATVSLERGIAWLSLDDLSAETSTSIEGLITSFAQGLSRAEVRLPAGCAECGSGAEVMLSYADGRCSRLCLYCRDRVTDEHSQKEAALNRPSVWHALALPLLFLYVSGAWMLFWWLVDLLLIWTNTDRIFIGRLESLVFFAVLIAVGAGIGYPIGVFLRRSGLPGRSHWIASAVVVVAACGFGEWLYVITLIHRNLGLIDPMLAARLFGPILRDVHPSWAALKLMVAGAIGVACYAGAQWRRAAVKL
jgi:hypothetical protein